MVEIASFDLANVALNLLALIVLVVGGVAAFLSFSPKRAAAVTAEKDQVILTHVQTIEALRARDDVREDAFNAMSEKLDSIEARMVQSAREASAWRARYEEQKQYTAGPALAAIQQLLSNQSEDQERRHRELMAAVGLIAAPGSGGAR